MKRILGLSLIVAALVSMVADTAEARFGRRRCRSGCNTCNSCGTQNGCAPQQGMAYADPNAQNLNPGQPGYVPPAPQPNTTFYRGNPVQQPAMNQGQPRPAPAANLQGSANMNGVRANAKVQGAISPDAND